MFLAGDAAHIHSPVGGQGMNTGIQDAYNLGVEARPRRVAAQLAQSLLDSYDAERRPVAASTLEGTDLATKVVTLAQPRRARSEKPPGRRSCRDSRSCRKGSWRRPARSPSATAEAPSSTSSERRWRARRSGYASASGPRWRTGSASRARPNPATARLTLPSTIRRRFSRFCATRAARSCSSTAPHLRPRATRTSPTSRAACASAGPPTSSRGSSSRAAAVRQSSRSEERVLLDPKGALHRRYGAGSECLYLVRPDGYVGFRSQPASWKALEEHLSTLLLERPGQVTVTDGGGRRRRLRRRRRRSPSRTPRRARSTLPARATRRSRRAARRRRRGECSPLPWMTSTQRSPRARIVRRNSSSCARASRAPMPCRSRRPSTGSSPRRSLRSASIGRSTRRPSTRRPSSATSKRARPSTSERRCSCTASASRCAASAPALRLPLDRRRRARPSASARDCHACDRAAGRPRRAGAAAAPRPPARPASAAAACAGAALLAGARVLPSSSFFFSSSFSARSASNGPRCPSSSSKPRLIPPPRAVARARRRARSGCRRAARPRTASRRRQLGKVVRVGDVLQRQPWPQAPRQLEHLACAAGSSSSSTSSSTSRQVVRHRAGQRSIDARRHTPAQDPGSWIRPDPRTAPRRVPTPWKGWLLAGVAGIVQRGSMVAIQGCAVTADRKKCTHGPRDAAHPASLHRHRPRRGRVSSHRRAGRPRQHGHGVPRRLRGPLRAARARSP